MSFEWPLALLLLLIIPALIAVYVWMQRRRQQYALRYASVSLVAQAVGRGPGIKRHIPAALYLGALAALILALARPQASVPVLQNTGTIVLSIDVSGSMFARDVEPDRMEATKTAVKNFIDKQPDGVKIGIVSFSDFAALVAPPTDDRKTVNDAVSRLRPQRGTNIGSGLQVAIEALKDPEDEADVARGGGTTRTPTPTPLPEGAKNTSVSIVLLSDGQSNTGPDPLEVADEAVAQGIKVYTIGIGTPEGTVLQIQGRNVFTRLDETTLKGIAEKTGGKYFEAQDEDELKQIYDELSRERSFENKDQEITFAFAGVGLLISLLAGGFGLLWFNRLP
ncbi:MAG TPA: VWA domain-containing protein [Dehalococcoidia bacterium]|nr:VWA domain-containing protein [Dehalococcoidia bacterium]